MVTSAAMCPSPRHSRQVAVDLLEWDFAQKSPKSLQTVPVGVQATAEADPTATGSSSDAGGAESDSSGEVKSQESDESEPSMAAQTVGAALDNPFALGLLAGGVVLFILTIVLWLRLRARMQGRR